MKISHFLLLSILLISHSLSMAAPPQTSGRSLKTIVADKYPDGHVFIGATAHGAAFLSAPDIIALLDREFDYITPSNDFKQSVIHPDLNKWEWTLAEHWLAHAKSQGKILRIHGPISPQASKWAKDDQRSAAELRQNMQEYLSATTSRLAQHASVRWLDVVNETINEDGSWFGPKSGNDKWENPWTLLGFDKDPNRTPLYIAEAFAIANRQAPQIKQLINQHALTPASVAKMKSLVLYLRAKGLRVDGIGWQAHIDTGWEEESGNLALLDEYISWAHQQHLEFHITEFQSFIKTPKERASHWGKNPSARTDADLADRMPAQAATYTAVLSTLLKHRGQGLVAINYWHLIDSQSQKKDGNMFNEDGTPRPAYYAIQNLLEHPPQ